MFLIAILCVFVYHIRAGPHNKGIHMLDDAIEPTEWVDALERLLEIMPWTPWLVGVVVGGLFIRFVLCHLIRAWRCR